MVNGALSDGGAGARGPCRILAAVNGAQCADAASAAELARAVREADANGITLTVRSGRLVADRLGWLIDAAGDLDVVVAPYDATVARQISALRFAAWKIDPPLLTHLPLLEQAAADGRPVLAGVAGCTRRELDDAVCRLPVDATLLHTVMRPGAVVDVADVAHISALRHYGRRVGYSDRGVDDSPALVAVLLGAVVIEKPFTVDAVVSVTAERASLLPYELRALVERVRRLEAVLAGHGPRDPLPEELDAIEQDRVSIVASRMIPRGTAIAPDMLTLKAPGAGLSPRFLPLVEGRRVLYDIPEGAFVTLGVIEP